MGKLGLSTGVPISLTGGGRPHHLSTILPPRLDDRSGRLAVTRASSTPKIALLTFPAPGPMLTHLTTRRMVMKRQDDSQSSGRLGVTQPPVRSPVHPFTRSPVHPFTRSPVHPFTRSPVHPFTRSPVHPFTRSPVHPFTPFTRSPVHPFTRSPVHPFTRSPVHPSPAHPFTRSPASRLVNRTAAEYAAPVLIAAPSIGVAHTSHASLSATADHVGRRLHQSTEPALPATPARALSSPSVTAFLAFPVNAAPRSCKRRACLEAVVSRYPIDRMTLSFHNSLAAFPVHRRCKLILKEPHARAA